MKTSISTSSVLVCSLALLTSFTYAQTNNRAQQAGYKSNRNALQDNQAPKDLRLMRMSQFWGTDTTNKQANRIGEIDDVAIDMANHGELPYVAITFGGGLLDIGDKWVAVPFDALKIIGVHHNQVVVPVDRNTVKSAKGFDPGGEWPTTGEVSLLTQDGHDMMKENRQHRYAHKDARTRNQSERNDARRQASDQANARGDQQQKMQSRRAADIVRMTKILDKDAYDGQGKKLGRFADLLFDPDRGRLVAAVIEPEADGLEERVEKMTKGGELIVIPWSAVKSHRDGKTTLDLSAQQMAGYPKLSWDNWREQFDKNAVASLYQRDGETVYWSVMIEPPAPNRG